MSKRAHYFMVPEDDAAWCRFWAAYPKRVSKKDARKAWAELNPSPETVEKIVEALAWQSQQPMWVKDGGQYVPFPASWLRAERYDDEPPVTQAAKVPYSLDWTCPHVDKCESRRHCDIRAFNPEKYKQRGAA